MIKHGIDFHKIHWGAFTKQFQKRKNKNIKTLKSFANHIIKNPKFYNAITLKRANFYKHVINGGMIGGDDDESKNSMEYVNKHLPKNDVVFNPNPDAPINELLRRIEPDYMDYGSVGSSQHHYESYKENELEKPFEKFKEKNLFKIVHEPELQQQYITKEDENLVKKFNKFEKLREKQHEEFSKKNNLSELIKHRIDLKKQIEKDEYDLSTRQKTKKPTKQISDRIERNKNELEKNYNIMYNLKEKLKLLDIEQETEYERKKNDFLEKLKLQNEKKENLMEKRNSKTDVEIEREKQTSLQDIRESKIFFKENKELFNINFETDIKEIKKDIKEINKKKFNFDWENEDEITEEDTVFLHEARNINRAKEYVNYVKSENGLTEKYNSKEKQDELIKKSGQTFELACCGPQEISDGIGPWIEVLENGEHPETSNMIFSEFFIDKCHEEIMPLVLKKFPKFIASSQGGQAPQDNFDAENKIANEMKDYITGSGYNAKIRQANECLKEKKIMDLRIEFQLLLNEIEKNGFDDYKEVFYEMKKLLINKDEYEKYFYQNFKYYGIEIQVAKFNPINMSENISSNSSKAVENCIKGFNPKCISHFKEGKIVYYEYMRSHVKSPENLLYNKLMTEKINSKLGLDGTVENGLSFSITVAFNDCIGQYNYSKDKSIVDDNVVGTYKLMPARKGNNYKNYLIPIEKFKIIR